MIPYEIMGDQIQNIWSSGNSGFALTGGGGSYDKFPTAYTCLLYTSAPQSTAGGTTLPGSMTGASGT